MRRELDITDAETYTKIRAKYLRALENDEFATLPDSTLAKTFLRTYSEYLGLDAQLLIEEYRALHEPRGQGDMPALRPRGSRDARPRRTGPPIGPGGAFAIGIVLLLVFFAVLGLTGGDEDDGGDGDTTTEQASDEREARERRERRERREARERRERAAERVLRVRVTPTGPTYVCVDDARGRVSFEGNITGPRTFRGRRGGRLRINLGRAAVRLTVNGRRVPIEDGPSGAGFSFSRTGRATPLPPEDRPCA